MVVVDLDGKPVENIPVVLLLRKRNANQELIEISKLNLISTAKPLDYSIKLPEGENFQILATAKDDQGRANTTVSDIYVSRDLENLAAKTMENEAKSVVIVPDKPAYNVGDTARLTVNSPFWPAHGMVLFSRNALVRTQPIGIDSASTIVSVPITSDDYPDLMVELVLNGQDYAFATGQTKLSVPPLAKKLALTVKPVADPVKPGSKTTIALSLHDSAGGAVAGGHVAVAVVDESVFALREYKWPDPIDLFYPSQAQASLRDYLRKTIFLNRLDSAKVGQAIGRAVSALPPPPLPGSPMGQDAFAKTNDGGGQADRSYCSRTCTTANGLSFWRSDAC